MPDLKLSLPQRALLLILMAENAELSNREIEEKYAPGLKLTGKPRKALEDAKLIASRKGARNAFFFRLEDEGWRWCRDELTRAVPAGAGSAGHALYAVLRGLGRYLDRTNLSLAHVFGNESTHQATHTADEIEREIRRAYREVADAPGSWVGLADIREHLNRYSRPEVDGVLRLMARMKGVQIEEETNQKSLTSRDRQAAVNIGDRDQHVLAIGQR
jgi:hypothetical protein